MVAAEVTVAVPVVTRTFPEVVKAVPEVTKKVPDVIKAVPYAQRLYLRSLSPCMGSFAVTEVTKDIS